MSWTIILNFVVILVVIPILCARELPDSPCPENFRYRYNSTSRQWYGWGHVQKSQIQNTTDVTNFELYVKLIVNVPQDFIFDSEEWVDFKMNENFLEFIVHFPIQRPLPEIHKIIINDVTLCSTLSEINQKWKNFRLRAVLNNAQTVTIPSESSTIGSEQIICGTLHPRASATALVAGGEIINRGEWPWLVAIFGYTGPTLSFLCGGTLISDKLIITAAHCLFRRNGSRLRSRDIVAILGKYDLRKIDEEGDKIVYPDNVIIHRDYTFHNPDADIAILVAANSVEFSQFIRPICLWNSSETLEITNNVGIAAGWGMDEFGNTFSDLPRMVKMPIVANSVCRNTNQHYQLLLSERTLCAGWKYGTSGVCQGDSGGGYAVNISARWTLRGVVSTAPGANLGTCNISEYVVFTDVSKFIDWIISNNQTTND